MIDRHTVMGTESLECPVCREETEHAVVDSTEEGALGFDGQLRTCGDCGHSEEVRR